MEHSGIIPRARAGIWISEVRGTILPFFQKSKIQFFEKIGPAPPSARPPKLPKKPLSEYDHSRPNFRLKSLWVYVFLNHKISIWPLETIKKSKSVILSPSPPTYVFAD